MRDPGPVRVSMGTETMNIAITDGVQLNPPGFAAGLGAWSREDGLAGSATWAGASNAAIVPADQDNRVSEMPYMVTRQGADKRNVRVNFSKPVKGSVTLRVRMDDPN